MKAEFRKLEQATIEHRAAQEVAEQLRRRIVKAQNRLNVLNAEASAADSRRIAAHAEFNAALKD